MTLRSGTCLGPYQIAGQIGAGGMGEVYRAHDSRLGRDVAIKVLPPAFASDTERLKRFEEEARAVSALNHPNILTLHDIGIHESSPYLVMELLEGESLRERLNGKPMPVKRSVEIGLQLANGLAAAHEHGVIHRDLKPENVFLTKDGRVKILDFGLAKLEASRSLLGHSSDGSTVSLAAGGAIATEPGMVIGTVGYMSPEQVRGEALDGRSDLFALGVVLWEMVTGQRPFKGPSNLDTMQAILKSDPPELDMALKVPPTLERILYSCLAKVPVDRFHSAHDLAFALNSAMETSASAMARTIARAPRPFHLSLAEGVLVGSLLVWAGLALFHPASSVTNSPVAVRFLTYSGRDTSPAVSPDGRTIAFMSNRDGQSRIWLKQLWGGGEVALTTGPDDFPRFSPDGTSILFVRGEGDRTSLYRMSVLGTDIHKVVENATSADWSPDGTRIAFLRTTTIAGNATSTLHLIHAGGGSEQALAHFSSDYPAAPRWNPDGASIALTSDSKTGAGQIRKIYWVGVQDGTIRERQTATKFGAISSSVWVSAEELIYFQAESVTGNGTAASPSKAYRLNVKTGALRPLFWAPVAPSYADILPGGQVVFDGISGRQSLREYTLAPSKEPPRWLTRGNISDRQPVFAPEGEWVVFSSNRSGNLDLWAVSSRSGIVKRITDDAAEDWDPAFSPDGRHLLWSSNRSGAFEIWLANPDGSSARQVTQDGADAENPTMTRDGQWIIYTSTNPKYPGLWKIHPDGTGAELLLGGTILFLPEASPDGQYVLYRSQFDRKEMMLHAIRIDDGSKEVFKTMVGRERKAVVSPGRSRWMPDGRHIIFTGQDEAGKYGVFVQAFLPGRDTSGTRKPLAGFDPDWITESLGLSPDGKRLVLAESERMFNILVAEGAAGLPTPRQKRN